MHIEIDINTVKTITSSDNGYLEIIFHKYESDSQLNPTLYISPTWTVIMLDNMIILEQ